MALTPTDNETFVREVDEELRRDQMHGFVQRYGKLLIAAVILFLAAVGGYLWWQNHRQGVAETQAEGFSTLLADMGEGKVKGGDPRIEKIAKEGEGAYRTQAQLLKAGLAAQEGRDAEAIAGFRAIANDADVPQPFREAALIRQTALEYDKLEPAAVIQRLKGFAVPGNPWFGSAGEMVGIAYMRQGKPQLASPIFAALAKDEKVPPGIRQRTNEVALSLGVDTGLNPKTGRPVAAKEASR